MKAGFFTSFFYGKSGCFQQWQQFSRSIGFQNTSRAVMLLAIQSQQGAGKTLSHRNINRITASQAISCCTLQLPNQTSMILSKLDF